MGHILSFYVGGTTNRFLSKDLNIKEFLKSTPNKHLFKIPLEWGRKYDHKGRHVITFCKFDMLMWCICHNHKALFKKGTNILPWCILFPTTLHQWCSIISLINLSCHGKFSELIKWNLSTTINKLVRNFSRTLKHYDGNMSTIWNPH